MSRCAGVLVPALIGAALGVALVWGAAPRCAWADPPPKGTQLKGPASKPAQSKPAESKPPQGSTKASPARPTSSPATAYAATPKHPGVLKLKRGGRTVTITLAHDGAIAADGVEALSEVMKHKSGAKHGVDEAFAGLLVAVSDHFGGKVIDVVDGFRPPPGHSNHNLGKAIDLRIEGVPIEAVRDYCQTLDRVGVGFYPAGKYVHLDVRKRSKTWTDDTPLPHSTAASRGPTSGGVAKAGSARTPPVPRQPPVHHP